MASQEHLQNKSRATHQQMSSSQAKRDQPKKHARPSGGVDDVFKAIENGLKHTLTEFQLIGEEQNKSLVKNEGGLQIGGSAGGTFQKPFVGAERDSLSQFIVNSVRLLGGGGNKILSNLQSSENLFRNVPNSKLLRSKLLLSLQDKIELVRLAQMKKRELKALSKQQKKEAVESKTPKKAQQEDPEKLEAGDDDMSTEGAVAREVLIRLKPLNEVSKDIVGKEKKKNPLMQFRHKVLALTNCLHLEIESNQKTVKDIIQMIADKWGLKQRQIELRLCQSAAEIVHMDSRKLIKFDKHDSQSYKLADLIPPRPLPPCGNYLPITPADVKPATLYLLYEIKRLDQLSEDEDEVLDTEEEEALNCQDDDEESSQGESSEEPTQRKDGEDEDDEEGKQYMDIITDILSLIVLNKKQKEPSEEDTQQPQLPLPQSVQKEIPEELDMMKDSQLGIFQKYKKPAREEQTSIEDFHIEASSKYETEMPPFAQGMELFSHIKHLKENVVDGSQTNKQSFKGQLTKKPSLSFGQSIISQRGGLGVPAQSVPNIIQRENSSYSFSVKQGKEESPRQRQNHAVQDAQHVMDCMDFKNMNSSQQIALRISKVRQDIEKNLSSSAATSQRNLDSRQQPFENVKQPGQPAKKEEGSLTGNNDSILCKEQLEFSQGPQSATFNLDLIKQQFNNQQQPQLPSKVQQSFSFQQNSSIPPKKLVQTTKNKPLLGAFGQLRECIFEGDTPQQTFKLEQVNNEHSLIKSVIHDPVNNSANEHNNFSNYGGPFTQGHWQGSNIFPPTLPQGGGMKYNQLSPCPYASGNAFDGNNSNLLPIFGGISQMLATNKGPSTTNNYNHLANTGSQNANSGIKMGGVLGANVGASFFCSDDSLMQRPHIVLNFDNNQGQMHQKGITPKKLEFQPGQTNVEGPKIKEFVAEVESEKVKAQEEGKKIVLQEEEVKKMEAGHIPHPSSIFRNANQDQVSKESEEQESSEEAQEQDSASLPYHNFGGKANKNNIKQQKIHAPPYAHPPHHVGFGYSVPPPNPFMMPHYYHASHQWPAGPFGSSYQQTFINNNMVIIPQISKKTGVVPYLGKNPLPSTSVSALEQKQHAVEPRSSKRLRKQEVGRYNNYMHMQTTPQPVAPMGYFQQYHPFQGYPLQYGQQPNKQYHGFLPESHPGKKDHIHVQQKQQSKKK